MSGDEALVTAIAIGLGPAAWFFWLAGAQSLSGFPRAGRPLTDQLLTVLGVCTVILIVVLLWGAADDVRNAPQYLFMYTVLGWAWMRVAQWWFPFVGLHPRDDVFERRNAAAVPSWSGAMIGVTLCYAGGNVGNGPGWWVVVFSGLLATGTLAAVWGVVGRRTGLVDAVMIDRDPASGWRLGGFLCSVGLVCGFGVTGDWASAPATVADFVMRVWPVLILSVLVAFFERTAQPTPKRPRGSLVTAGVAPAVTYVAIALAIVALEWPRW